MPTTDPRLAREERSQEEICSHLVVEVVEVAGDKHMDVPHDLQHIQPLIRKEKARALFIRDEELRTLQQRVRD